MSPAPTKWDRLSPEEKREACSGLDFAIRMMDNHRWAIEHGREAEETVYIPKPDIARGTMGRWESRPFRSVADVDRRQATLRAEFAEKRCAKHLDR